MEVEHIKDYDLLSYLKYIQILLAIRLLRFILRFTCAIILMLIACIGWLCRKRVQKGRVNKDDEKISSKLNEQELFVYDGVPLE